MSARDLMSTRDTSALTRPASARKTARANAFLIMTAEYTVISPMRWPLHVLVGAALALSLPACGISSPSNNKEETFSGTLTVGGANPHNFSSGNTGEFSVKVTALSPDSAVLVGIAFG